MARPPLDHQRIDPVIAAYRRSGLSVARIALRLGISPRSVDYALQRINARDNSLDQMAA